MVYFARQLDVGLTEFSPREAERLVRELQKKDECLNELVPWFFLGEEEVRVSGRGVGPFCWSLNVHQNSLEVMWCLYSVTHRYTPVNKDMATDSHHF